MLVNAFHPMMKIRVDPRLVFKCKSGHVLTEQAISVNLMIENAKFYATCPIALNYMVFGQTVDNATSLGVNQIAVPVRKAKGDRAKMVQLINAQSLKRHK